MFGQNIVDILLKLPWVLLALTFHEFCHAWVSDHLGDPTPKLEGRLSLNPLVHTDFFGMLILLIAGFGWAKPVQINPRYYKNPMQGTLWVSLAGPLGNLILAVLIALIVRLFFKFGILVPYLNYFIIGMYITLGLGFFNLIPIPPLDGSKVLRYYLSGNVGYYFDRFEPYGFFLLILLLFIPIFWDWLSYLVRISALLLIGSY